MDTGQYIIKQRKRDRFRSLASATSIAIKHELSKYYETPSPTSHSSRTISSTSSSSSSSLVDPINDEMQCIIFPTYATLVKNERQQLKWKVKISGWTYTLPVSSRVNRWMLAAGLTYGGVASNSAEYAQFTNLFNQFRSETRRGIELTIGLTEGGIMETINSGPSGRFEHILFLDPNECIGRIQRKCLELETRFVGLDHLPPHLGKIDMIEPTGISIVSDIDDTIKITDILDGKDMILQNTFFREAKQVPGMSKVYQAWSSEGASFHYVSNSPWQVYPALQKFLQDNQFPQGSIHLRLVSTQSLILGKPGKHKWDTITAILKDFPERKFILIGDSGEIDPEIFAKIYHQYPDQIVKILIHDVTSERAIQSDRRAASRAEGFYDSIKKFMDSEVTSPILTPGHINTSSEKAMDAMLNPEIPQDQQQMMDPTIPLHTKLEQFEQRMYRVSAGMRYGVFSVFSLASQLILDSQVTEELYMAKKLSPLV